MTFDAIQAERYIEGLVESGWSSSEGAGRAIGFLRELQSRVPRLPLPTVAPGPDGLIGFTWRTDSHYLSLELHTDGRVEAFHENLSTKRLWSAEGDTIPEDFIERIAQTV